MDGSLARRFAELIVPRALLGGVALAFLACVAGGWLASYRNPYRHFVRFHQLLSPESLYHPTVSQLRALVAAKVPAGRIAVIVGGSSIMNGVGQNVDDIWTRRLEERLGEPYRVVNLAMRAGQMLEAGALAAESLIKDGAPVIFVADLGAGRAWSPPGRYYGYMFWDAYYKRLLIDDPARERRLRELLQQGSAASRLAHLEQRLGGVLDSAVRFNDLWNTLGYRRFFTVWNFLAMNAPFGARRTFPDVPAKPLPFAQRYPESRRAEELRRLRGMIERRRAFIEADQRTIVGRDSPSWEEIRADLETGLPLAMRRRTLVVVVRASSYYLPLLTGEERHRFDEVMRGSVKVLGEAGYEAVAEGDQFTVDDFADALHLGPSGAAKLVDLVAPRIRGMAERLGYLQ